MTTYGAVSPDRPGTTRPDAEGQADSRTLVVAWQHPASRLISPVGLLDHDGPRYRFRYLRSALDVVDFQPFVSFPRWEEVYEGSQLFPLFAQRIMSPRRPDYLEYLRQLNLTRSEPSPWEVLARSEGRRTGDTVQVFPVPVVEAGGTTRCTFLVHGVRWVLGDRPLEVRPGDSLALEDEPENPVTSQAVRVLSHAGQAIGYVPHLLLEHLNTARDHGPVDLRAEHVNGSDVPSHLRVLARLEATVPAGYRPMTGLSWQTFV